MLYILSGIYALGWTDETAIFIGQKLIFPVHMAQPNKRIRNSLAVQWLRLRAFPARPGVQSLFKELKSRKPHSAAKKIKTKFLKILKVIVVTILSLMF